VSPSPGSPGPGGVTVCKRFVAVTDAPSSAAAALATEAATNVESLLAILNVANPSSFVTITQGNPAEVFASLTITVQQIPVASAAEAAALYASLDSATVASVLLDTANVTSIQDKSPEVYGASTCFKPAPGGSPSPGASPASPGACSPRHHVVAWLSTCASSMRTRGAPALSECLVLRHAWRCLACMAVRPSLVSRRCHGPLHARCLLSGCLQPSAQWGVQASVWCCMSGWW
jgi:hypothetical protein